MCIRDSLWVNVAEDVGHSFTIEAHTAFASRFIQTQIESFAVVKRKHIVKKRVIVGKLHQAANGYNQQMRIELLVPVSYTHLDVYKRQG